MHPDRATIDHLARNRPVLRLLHLGTDRIGRLSFTRGRERSLSLHRPLSIARA